MTNYQCFPEKENSSTAFWSLTGVGIFLITAVCLVSIFLAGNKLHRIQKDQENQQVLIESLLSEVYFPSKKGKE